MLIYIVWFNNFHSQDEFVGAYSSQELAQAKIDKYDRMDARSMRVEPQMLDE